MNSRKCVELWYFECRGQIFLWFQGCSSTFGNNSTTAPLEKHLLALNQATRNNSHNLSVVIFFLSKNAKHLLVVAGDVGMAREDVCCCHYFLALSLQHFNNLMLKS